MNKEIAEKLAAITGKPISEYYNGNEIESREYDEVTVAIDGDVEEDGLIGCETDGQDEGQIGENTKVYPTPIISRRTKITNKNKSKDGTLHKCDYCGSSPEELWSDNKGDGQYCFEHFRLRHEDVDIFDEWCKRFNV